MIDSTPKFVAKHVDKDGEHIRVLEVGCLYDGQNLRDLMPSGSEYIGTDMREGPNVDLVINAHDLVEHFGEESFDLVMCFDTFEHDDKFWVSWENMKAVLKSGGSMLLGVPGRNCPYHSHPKDYWRFTPDAFEDFFFKDFDNVVIETSPKESIDDSRIGDNWTYGKGTKR